MYIRSAESIIGSLEAKVIDLKERMHTCITSGAPSNHMRVLDLTHMVGKS